MPKTFFKEMDCGCIVEAMVCGIEPGEGDGERGQRFVLGSHQHVKICEKCKALEEEQEQDTLHDMWKTDNTVEKVDLDGSGWKQSPRLSAELNPDKEKSQKKTN